MEKGILELLKIMNGKLDEHTRKLDEHTRILRALEYAREVHKADVDQKLEELKCNIEFVQYKEVENEKEIFLLKKHNQFIKQKV